MSKHALVHDVARLVTGGVLVLAVGACGADSSLPTLGSSTSTTSSMTIAGGNNQRITVGTSVPNPLSVRVTNQRGSPVSGVAVTWTITAGGGSLSKTATTTDSTGVATTTYTAGVTAGTATVTATAEGLSTATFTILVIPLMPEGP
jgi:hypothetical protein